MGLSIIKFVLALCCFALSALNVGAVEEPSDRELQIEAAFLFHFTQFTEWPTISPVFHYCVYEDSGFTELLQKTYSGKTIGEVQIDVKNINAQTQIDDCHIIFFPKTVPPDFMEKVRKHAILSVGMQKDFSKAGGIIYLYEDDEKMRFYVDNKAATDAGLKISSQLLKLSKEP